MNKVGILLVAILGVTMAASIVNDCTHALADGGIGIRTSKSLKACHQASKLGMTMADVRMAFGSKAAGLVLQYGPHAAALLRQYGSGDLKMIRDKLEKRLLDRGDRLGLGVIVKMISKIGESMSRYARKVNKGFKNLKGKLLASRNFAGILQRKERKFRQMLKSQMTRRPNLKSQTAKRQIFKRQVFKHIKMSILPKVSRLGESNIRKNTKNIGNDFKEAIMKAKKAINEKIREAATKAKTTVIGIKNESKATAQKVVNKGKEAVNEVKKITKNNKKNVKETVCKVKQSAKESTKGAVNKGTTEVKHVGKKVIDLPSEILKKMKLAIDEINPLIPKEHSGISNQGINDIKFLMGKMTAKAEELQAKSTSNGIDFAIETINEFKKQLNKA